MHRKNFMRSETHICGNVALGQNAELAAGGGIVPGGARELVFGGEVRESRQGAQGAIGIALGVRLGDAEVAVASVAFGAVAFAAQHLKVFECAGATLAARDDVIHVQ